MTQENNGIFGEDQSKVTVRERLSRYLANWPLFLVCIILSVGAGLLYIRSTIPKYRAITYFLIKGTESGRPNSEDLIESAMNGKREVNLNNEMMLISAASLMERTVARNGLDVSYFKKGRILNIDIYKDAPFTLIAKQLTDSNHIYNIYIKKFDTAGGTFLYAPEKEEKLYSFRWNEPFSVSGQSFVLEPKRTIQSEDGEYIVRWQPVAAAAAKLSKDLTVKAYDTKTSVIQLSVKTANLQKGKDLLNALLAEYNMSDIEDRNKLSESTVRFIDDRLLMISEELKGVEGNLEDYQGSNQLVDIKGQSTQSLQNSNDVSKTIKYLAIQQSVTSMILEYFANPANSNKLVPSSLGLNDGTLASLITQYNELQLKKERETPSVAPNSTVMQDLNAQLSNLKGSILESLNNITKNLRLQEDNFRQQNSQYRNFLSSVPHNERVLQEIRRKQSITEGLYLYLLQKREEAAISSTASNVAHYKQIDPATGYGPVEPNSTNIIVYTALLGFLLAFGLIYFRTLLNDKITSKEDIIKRTSLAVLGQIGHISKRKKQIISVLDRNVIGEQFRAIRTNLSFLLKDKSKNILLVTSSVSNEGKSLISLNLAAVYAMPGKKVALLEFDIRQPALRNNLNVDSTKGLTSYLTGEISSLSEIGYGLDEIPGLHIYPSGPIPIHPADLLLTENMQRLFEALKAEYDYIIIDSPPACLVSDPIILGKYSDLVVYIVRNQKTLKKQLDFINEIATNKTLNNIYLVLNDIETSDKYDYGNYYGYGKSKKRKPEKEKISLN
jgi:capsular exopolysaccharide synthesis family protein